MIKKLLGVIRAPFLLLVPACLAPVFALAYRGSHVPDTSDALLVAVGALLAHIAVNALNEYQDFRSGLDFATRRTPFSGGSGTLVEDADFAPVALTLALVALLAVTVIGLYFLLTTGVAVLVPGLVGVVIIIGYTRWLNRSPLLCLLAPGIGFGLLMVNLSYLILASKLSWQVVAVSVTVCLLVSNLLLINQLPDIDTDRRAGRRHLAIVYGPRCAAQVSGLLLAGAYTTIVIAVVAGLLPPLVLLALLTLPAALMVVIRAVRFSGENIEQLIPAMALNVAVTLSTPVLVAVGIILS